MVASLAWPRERLQQKLDKDSAIAEKERKEAAKADVKGLYKTAGSQVKTYL